MVIDNDIEIPDGRIQLDPLSPLPTHPLVSVICLSLNSAAYLEETIHSILQQDYEPLELIIVDGGSNDGTLDIIHRHEGDSRLRWLSEPDNGPFEAVNKGIHLARGELLGVMPASDTYVQGAIREIVQEFTSAPNLVYVGGWTEVVDEMGVPIGNQQWAYRDKHDYSLDDVLKFPRLPKDQASLWRRDIALAIGGYDETFKLPNSFYTVHYMLEASIRGGYARAVPRVWATFRLHENQRHSRDSALELLQDRNLGFKQLAEQYRRYLTRKQRRLLRRTGYRFLLKYWAQTPGHSRSAITDAFKFLWFGGGPNLLRRSWPYLLTMLSSRLRAPLRK